MNPSLPHSRVTAIQINILPRMGSIRTMARNQNALIAGPGECKAGQQSNPRTRVHSATGSSDDGPQLLSRTFEDSTQMNETTFHPLSVHLRPCGRARVFFELFGGSGLETEALGSEKRAADRNPEDPPKKRRSAALVSILKPKGLFIIGDVDDQQSHCHEFSSQALSPRGS